MTTESLTDPGRLPALGRESAQELIRELADADATARSGVLRVTGEPGGDLHVEHGRIVAVDSPGAPGVRELLSRPGRTSTGAADLRVVAMMAAMDGLFAITVGWIGSCFWQDPPAGPSGTGDPAPRVPGIDPGWLLLETERRLRALAHGRVSPHRNLLVLNDSGRMALSVPSSSQQQEILVWVNGRRSCRDIAMLLSRSLYAVTVEVVRMLDADLLRVVPPERASGGPEEPDGPARNAAPRSMLPRRRRGASGINDTIPPRAAQPAARGTQRTALVRTSERTQ
ncbi:DUF4388 domain-containing protein [Nocardia jejuensis]|uniref:DUF4388 domain-containing protein n=1 Tax=Nocardia jejuensis TaxID=328049 RepID=UPI00083777AA|nr:DUF4388 domain-containing protein [Nocardia jejuensis]